MKKVTITDIAKLTGYSIKTVSRVINNAPNVKEETRRKILRVIEEHNYSVNLLAKALRNSETRTVILFIDRRMGEYWNEWHDLMLKSLMVKFRNRGYKVILSPSSGEETISDDTDGFHLLKSGLADGAIMFDVISEDCRVRYLRANNIPFVIIGKDKDFSDTTFVDLDNYLVGYIGAEYLINKGYENIALFLGPKVFNVNRERAQGFEEACEKHGIAHSVFYGLSTIKRVYEKTHELLDKSIVDAFFISGDAKVLGAYRAIREKGLKIPEDVAVLGIDNLPSSEYMYPPLTSIDQNVEKFSDQAVNLLIEMMHSKKKSPKRIILPPRIIERQSV
ncbi:LacI family DNA-binding transcriptional regulator [Kosmotoga olearia]|uniref:Transcriptional regulator, LacI family n=1 Tax=Kosmotoga olearia (strain ATCC BAA-1733 / DSM 21960 / TBF 19.5.1) TaxID=521045 RepID=C5CJ04_KOSOT|nr:LacI family DNA-binding transcriptional regulator [Kosmotoga olearia]ACR79920.1 transcriptional regulator, LacI family [Kosmotoga olearia TBF 19.5.1]